MEEIDEEECLKIDLWKKNEQQKQEDSRHKKQKEY